MGCLELKSIFEILGSGIWSFYKKIRGILTKIIFIW